MTDTPWTAIRTPATPDADCTAVASTLTIRLPQDMAMLLQWTTRIQDQLEQAPGLIGYALAVEQAAGTLWTVSAWTTRSHLLVFDRSHPHAAAKAHLRDLLVPSVLAVWTLRTDQLPIGWAEVRTRISSVHHGCDA